MTQLTLKELEKTLDERFKVQSHTIKDGIREEIKVATREIISHFNSSQVLQNERMDKSDKRLERIETKLEDIGDDVSKIKLAVVDLMGTDKHLHNLVEELQRQGIPVDRQKVFAR